jgi:hypothetical protein
VLETEPTTSEVYLSLVNAVTVHMDFTASSFRLGDSNHPVAEANQGRPLKDANICCVYTTRVSFPAPKLLECFSELVVDFRLLA